MKKLRLNRSTVRILTGPQARTVAGGLTADCTTNDPTNGFTCWNGGCQGPTLDDPDCMASQGATHCNTACTPGTCYTCGANTCNYDMTCITFDDWASEGPGC